MKHIGKVTEKVKWPILIIAIVAGIAIWFIPINISPEAHAVFAIMVVAGILWFTEAIPLFITSLLIPLLAVVFAKVNTEKALGAFFDPVVVLILGGFVIGLALEKHKVSEKIAYKLVEIVGTKPEIILLALIFVTGFFSFWMANTAATAMILPIGLIILAKNGLVSNKSKYGKSLVIGIGYAATIGGTATLVGTPANAMAAKFLADNGITLSFFKWMVMALPYTLLMLFMVWLVLFILYKPEIKHLKVRETEHFWKMNVKQKLVLIIFAATVGLWLTTSYSKLNIGIIALIPIALYYMTGCLNTSDFVKVDWGTLIMIGGGISLGAAISATKLDLVLAEFIKSFVMNQPIIFIMFVLAGFTMILTSFASNTATAAILIPIVIPLAMSMGLPVLTFAVMVAVAASLDFILPVGTPPTAMAYGTGYVTVREIVKPGLIITFLALIFLVIFAKFVWPFLL